MATGFEFFERDLRVATAGMEPEAINQAVAVFAKQEVRRLIAEGAASPRYERYVNGVHGAPEESYRAPGAIVYEFTNWPLVINAVLEELKKRGPRPRTGQFDNSFVVIVGGRVLVTDYSKIRSDAEVIILNATPYSRKAEVGRLGIPEQRLFKGTARVIASRFNGAFTVTSRFLNVPSGIHSLMPYHLKNRGRSNDRISRKSGVLTYPAIIINPVA
ncbi:MAG: hypothetical protein ACTHNH_08460 [Mesorhizobium sp.]